MSRSPNLLARDTTLAALDRVPAYADDLFVRVSRRDSGSVLASGLVVLAYRRMFERLGLALVARDEIHRDPHVSLVLRLHIASLLTLVGSVLDEAARFVTAFFDIDEDIADRSIVSPAFIRAVLVRDVALGRVLDQQRAGLRRIVALAADATEPTRLCIQRASDPAGPVVLDGDVELTEEGVALVEGTPRRSWRPVPEVADVVIADTANLLEAVAGAIIRAIDGGHEIAMDLRVERLF